MIEFSFSRFHRNPFEKHIARIEKVIECLERLETMGGNLMTEITEEDKKNTVVATKYLETARAILRKSDCKK